MFAACHIMSLSSIEEFVQFLWLKPDTFTPTAEKPIIPSKICKIEVYFYPFPTFKKNNCC